MIYYKLIFSKRYIFDDKIEITDHNVVYAPNYIGIPYPNVIITF